MAWSLRRRHKPPQDARLTDAELAAMEDLLRHQIQTLFRKVWFVDQETGAFLQPEDKIALANDGIDALVDDFTAYMRARVKPNPEAHGTTD